MSPDRPLRKKTFKVLLAADDRREVSLIRRSLRRGRGRLVKVVDVPTVEGALAHLEREDVDLVMLDLGLGVAFGADIVRGVRRTAPTIPIIVIADEADERLAILALQRDAQDYVLRHQLNPATLTQAVRYALEPDRWQGQHRRLLGISPDGVVIVDADGRVLFVNSTAAGMLGHAPTRSEELPPSMRAGVEDAVDVSLEGGRAAEIREVETLWSGRPARLITMRDVTDRLAAETKLNATAMQLQEANERLERLVDTDPLTNVLNRRGLHEALHAELRRMGRTGDTLMAILIDCDDFKSINDSFGHGVGDAALTALARGVQDTLRAGDHVGRVGGDEFLVLLPSTTIAEGLVVAEKVRRAVKATALPLSADDLTLSVSLAVGPVSRDVVSVEEILTSVADGLKESKQTGKDVVSESRTNGVSPSRVQPRTVLDPSTVSLHVVVQEIHVLDDGGAVGCEALTRGPRGAFAMPADLFRAAFEQNALTALDLRALKATMESLRERSWPGWYHVNLFPSTLLNIPPDCIIPLLDRGGTRERVCVELSEQQFLGDPAYLRPMIRELRAVGYRVAIDDVGFGRSSVEALMLLEPDVVKVDRRCIRSVASDAGERRQLERLLAMLRAVDAIVIVEGVETAEELRILRDLGVLYGQGYLWGKPARSLPRSPGVRGRQPLSVGARTPWREA
ncbi:MAG TPA: diguanylate cyclase [Longimicrobiales bacterium]|nr:diguanylate cyclase [Longimicrobiales bacterium]